MRPDNKSRNQAQQRWLRLTGVALVLSLLGLVAGTVMLALQAEETDAHSRRQADLSGRLRALQTVLVSLGDAERGQRGYLLTGRDSYLDPYRAAMQRMPELLQALDSVPMTDPALPQLSARARSAVEQKLTELDKAIQLHERGLRDDALAAVISDSGERFMDQAHAAVNAVLDSVRSERDRLNLQVAEGSRQTRRLAVLAVSTLLLFITLVGVQIALLLASRRGYERALEDSEQRYRALVEEQAELVSLAREDGALVYANPSYSRYFLKPNEDFFGRSLYDFVAPADREQVRRQIAAVLESGQTARGENRIHTPDGREQWVSWTNRLQRGPQGERLLHSVGRDVTARRQAEQALQASEDFLARTGRLAGVGGWEVDIATGRMRWSEAVRRIHEAPADFVPTLEGLLALYPPEAREALNQRLQAAVQRREPWELEVPLTPPTGRRLWVRMVGEAEFDTDGTPRRHVGACQDVTDRKTLELQLAENARFVREVTDNLPVRLAYFDRDGRYQFVNAAHCKRFGKPRSQIVGRTRSELTRGSTDELVAPYIDGVLAGQPQRFEFDEVVDGQLRRIESQLTPDFDAQGRVRGYYSAGVDVTERRAAEGVLRGILEAIPAIVAVVGKDGRYRFVNRAFERWSGLTRAQVVGRTTEEVLGPETTAASEPWARRALAGETVSFERVHPGRRGPQHLSLSYVPLRLDDGRIDGYIGVAQDITVHKAEEVRLLHLSERDALTGLLNRAGFERYLQSRTQEGGAAQLALLYIDLDHFKPINDTHGHPVGDELLRAFGQRLLHLVRPSDAVARLGGDEFGVVIASVRERATAEALADKVVEAARADFEIGRLRLQVGASVGVALDAQHDGGWKGLVARADAAVYRAKAAGRGRRA